MKTKLQTWHEMATLLKVTKDREAELRRELCDELIGGAPMDKGRVTVKGIDSDSNLQFTAVQTLSHRVDTSILDTLWSSMTELDKNAVVYKPALALAAYKKLPLNSLLHEAVITTLAMPTLKVEGL